MSLLLPKGLLCSGVLLLASAAGGCSADETANPGPPDKPAEGAIGSACDGAHPCNDGGKCLTDPSFAGGYCYAECGDDPTACPEGSTCHEYIGYTWCFASCDKDDTCRADEGYVCDYGVCRPACANDRACLDGDTCRGGHCLPPCTKDEECPGGRCQDGECLPPCKNDGECLPGFSCDTASGLCKAKPGNPMGEACAESKECATGYCLPTRKICSVKCAGSATCPKSYVCGMEKLDQDRNGISDGAESDCVPIVGDGGPGATCTKDEDCASSHCYDGMCLEGCAEDKDCTAPGMQCVDTRLLVGGGIPTYRGCLPQVGVAFHYPLGTFKPGDVFGFDIPSNASSFIVTTRASTGQVGAIALATDPAGNQLTSALDSTDPCRYFAQMNRYAPDMEITSLFVPNTPTVKLQPGIHELYVTASGEDVMTEVFLTVKLGKASKGTININWYFLNLAGTCIEGPTLNAQSAPNHAWLKKIADSMAQILAQAKISVGAQTYNDLKNPALDVLTLNEGEASPELDALLSSGKAQTNLALNIYLVREIAAAGAMAGGIVLGYGGGIPGPAPLHDTIRSGAVLSVQTACFEPYGYNPGHTLAHEIAHHLGLFHSQEAHTNPGYDMSTGEIICPCPCGDNMTCEYSYQLTDKWCRGLDHLPDTQTSNSNLMFYAAENTQDFSGNQLTPGQIRVMLDNPLVGH